MSTKTDSSSSSNTEPNTTALSKQPDIEITLLPEHDQPLSLEQRDMLLPKLSDWSLVERNNVECLQRVYHFSTYSRALNFTYHLGELCKQAERYPTLMTALQKITVAWHTPEIGLLTTNDVLLAENTDTLFSHTNK